jgi:glycosyltransferase involved in cell wall biosynthesis
MLLPEMSVIMAVRNGEPFLGHAIDGILRQTYPDFEFVIVDDGSTDASANIVRSFSDSRIVFVQNDRNLGLTKSLNRGLALARSAVVARQDADDISLPHRLARQKQYLEAHPDVSLVGSGYETIDGSGRSSPAAALPQASDEIRWALLFYCPLVHGAVTARKTALESVGGYNEGYHYAQDYELWTRMAPAHCMVNLDEVLVKYRLSASSMTATHPAAATEPVRIGVSALRDLSGWAFDDASVEERLRDMQRMLKPDTDTGPPRNPGRAWRDILFLHDTFCARYAVTEHRRQVLRRDLVRSVAGNLVHHHARQDVRAGRYVRAASLMATAARVRSTALTRGRRLVSGMAPDGRHRDCQP